MQEIITHGDICLDDGYNLTYKVADITYTEREDESFVYEIRPNYSVIELLSPDIFQGIPGCELDLRKECYIRENIVPVFISERTPGRNREDLWSLLDDCKMQYLNRLEWLIRTDTRYSGDSLYVRMHENKKIEVSSLNLLGNRSAVICHNLLKAICYGGDVSFDSVIIDDTNRSQFYELLFPMYVTEKKYLDSQRRNGISQSAKAGNYKGRSRIRIDKLEAQELFLDYEANKISCAEGAYRLGISKSTFLRRYREYRNLNQ